MAFQNVPGNARIKTILRASLGRKRVPPALLFAGPEGSGRRETALELAKALNCRRLEDDACDDCPSCRAIGAGNHPDIIEVIKLPWDPDKDNNGAEGNGPMNIDNIRIKQTKRMIELAHMKPMIGRKRVFLIGNADEMEEAAAQSSLKILEEPPESAQFILITSKLDALPPTITSRCRTLAFQPVAFDEIVDDLRGRGVEEAEARIIASVARGNLDQARELGENWEDAREKREEAWNLFRSILGGSPDFLEWFASLRKTAVKDELEKILVQFQGFLRDLLLLGESAESAGLFNPDLEGSLRAIAPVSDPERVLRMSAAVDGALLSMERNANAALLAGAFYARMTG